MAKLYGNYGPDEAYIQKWKNAPLSQRAYMDDPYNEAKWKYRSEQERLDKDIWKGVADPFHYALGGGKTGVDTYTEPAPTDPRFPSAGRTGSNPTTGTPTGSPITTPTPTPTEGNEWWRQPPTPTPLPMPTGTNSPVGDGIGYDLTSNTPGYRGIQPGGGSPITTPQQRQSVGTNTPVYNPSVSGGQPISNTGSLANATTNIANTVNKVASTTNPGIRGGTSSTVGQGQQTPTIGVDPTTGRLTFNGEVLERNDPRLWGRVGRNVMNTAAPGASENYDPRYYETYQESMGDAGEQTFYRLRPEVAARLGNRIQVSSSGVGGYGEIIDPSKVEYDEEFGVVTDRSNVKEPGGSNFINRGGIFAAMAAPFLGPMALEALGGGGGVAGAGALTEATAPLVTETLAGAPTIAGVGGGGAAGAGLFGSGVTGSQILSGARTALGVAGALGLTGNQGGGRGSFLNNAISGGIANEQANRNMDRYEQRVRDMIERGDPYGPERADAIRRLRELEANPGALANNKLFKDMQTKSDENLSRLMAARGYLGSGNEMGALHENFSANLNKFYKDEWERTAREAGVYFDPTSMASAGINSAGRMYDARTNRDAGLQAFIQRNGGLDGIWGLINSWLGGDNQEQMTEEEFDSWWNNFQDGISNYSNDGDGEYI